MSKPKDAIKNANKKMRNAFLARAALALAEGVITQDDFKFLTSTKKFQKDADGLYIKMEPTEENIVSVLKKLRLKNNMGLL